MKTEVFHKKKCKNNDFIAFRQAVSLFFPVNLQGTLSYVENDAKRGVDLLQQATVFFFFFAKKRIKFE